MATPDIIRAHRHSSYHREEILESDLCGCFSCARHFSPREINSWTDFSGGEEKEEDGQTATCPICGVDAVIGSESGYPITEEFLSQMKAQWFRRGN